MADEKDVFFEGLWTERKLQFGVTGDDDAPFDEQFKPLAYDMFCMGWNRAFQRAGEIFVMIDQTQKAQK